MVSLPDPKMELTMRKSQPGWDPTIPKMFGYFVDLGIPWAWSTILVSLILAADLQVWNSLRTNLSKHLGIELETSRVCCVHWVRSVKVQNFEKGCGGAVPPYH